MQQKTNYKLIDLDNSKLHAVLMVNKLHPKNWIKELRKAKKITTIQLAEEIGMSSAYITMLEKRHRGLTWPTLKKLADALGCHPSDITDGPAAALTTKDATEKKILTIVRSMGEKDQERFTKMAEAYVDKDDDK